MHAGESLKNNNMELYDAILLGSKRIGHGFALIKHPNLIELIKEKNICIECSPVSNKCLGYQNDLRIHPTRSLLTKGIKVSINPSNQGYFNTPGVTFDYLVAYLAWDMDLSDLKQLALNSLEFATITESEKDQVREFFKARWKKFQQFVKSSF